MAEKQKLMKVGYAAQAPVGADLSYWANLAAEITDLWGETKQVLAGVWTAVVAIWGILKQIWNLVLQVIQMVTAIVPIVRTLVKRWLDFIRFARQ